MNINSRMQCTTLSWQVSKLSDSIIGISMGVAESEKLIVQTMQEANISLRQKKTVEKVTDTKVILDIPDQI